MPTVRKDCTAVENGILQIARKINFLV